LLHLENFDFLPFLVILDKRHGWLDYEKLDYLAQLIRHSIVTKVPGVQYSKRLFI
jgi:hypothetical protein